MSILPHPHLPPPSYHRRVFSRDSEDSHEPSESPSPVERVNRARSTLGEDSSAFSQAPFSSSPPANFFNQSYPEAGHQQADLHSGIPPHSSRNYYAHAMDQSLSPPSSPWQTSPYSQYNPSSPAEYSPHARHSAPQHPGSSSEESTWELRGMGVSARDRVGDASTGWPPDNTAAVLGQQPLASLAGLRPQSPGMSTSPRTVAAASSWSWGGHDSGVGLHTSSQRDHSHRTVTGHRSSYSAGQMYGNPS